MYSISLDIAKVDKEEMTRQHEVIIKVETGGLMAITKTVEFNLAMKERESRPPQPEEKAEKVKFKPHFKAKTFQTKYFVAGGARNICK